MQDKAGFIELISKAWGNSPVTWLHSWLGVETTIQYALLKRWQGKLPVNKQPNLCLITHERERGPGTLVVCVCVCVGRQYVFIPLCSAFASLSPICTWEGSRRAAVPLKSSQRVCLCQPLACFKDYIFSFPFLNSPPCFASKESSDNSPSPPETHTHIHTSKTHIYSLKCCPMARIMRGYLNIFMHSKAQKQHARWG